MERSEPTLVPEWLKTSGSVSGGGSTTHQFAPSSLHSDDQHAVDKLARNKSSVHSNDHDLGRPSVLDKTTSSYFRRSSSSNGSVYSRSYSSFSRNRRDRDWDRDVRDYRDREKSVAGEHRHRDFSDPLESILPSRFERDGLRRSFSMVSGRNGDAWPRKIAAESSIANKKPHNDANDLLAKGSPGGRVEKAAFERDFPSLGAGAEERQTASEIGRIPSPGLSSAIQSLPISSSAVVGGDKWTSALAEVPAGVGNNGIGVSSGQQTAPLTSASMAPSSATVLNMAATVAQGPTRVQTLPQLSAGSQRLEELAIKQSRQLIPVTPSLPKASVLSSDKQKARVGQQQHPVSSSHLIGYSSRGGPVKNDVSKMASSVGKLQILKPSRERNSGHPVVKDSLSPTGDGRAANSALAAVPAAGGFNAVKSPTINQVLPSAERKPALTILEKRPTAHTQSRTDFFKLVREKSIPNYSGPSPSPVQSPSTLDKTGEVEDTSDAAHGTDAPSSGISKGGQVSENGHDLVINDGACDGKKYLGNSKKSDALLCSEEEEAAFLRSLGWEENADEDGLTEEEITSFYQDLTKYISSKSSFKILQGVQGVRAKVLLLLNLQSGSVGGITSGLSASDAKLKS